MPELEFLSSTLGKIIMLPTNDSTLYIYYYTLPPEKEDMGQASTKLSLTNWIVVDNSLPLNGDEDATLFHELTHVFAGTIDKNDSGIFHNAHNLETLYAQRSSWQFNQYTGGTDLPGGYGQLLLDSRRPRNVPALPPASPPATPDHRRGYGHLWTE